MWTKHKYTHTEKVRVSASWTWILPLELVVQLIPSSSKRLKVVRELPEASIFYCSHGISRSWISLISELRRFPLMCPSLLKPWIRPVALPTGGTHTSKLYILEGYKFKVQEAWNKRQCTIRKAQNHSLGKRGGTPRGVYGSVTGIQKKGVLNWVDGKTSGRTS